MLALVAVVGVLLLARFVYLRFTHIYIDDARIDGEVVTLSSVVSGRVTELTAMEGDEVHAGQVLVRIDSRDAVAARDLLLARLRTVETQMEVVRAQATQVDEETLGKYQSEVNKLAAAGADEASAAAQLRQAEAEYRRAQDLTAQKWLSPQALERTATELKLAAEKHRSAVAELAAARGTLAAAGGSRKQLRVVERQLAVLARQADEIRTEILRSEVDIANRAIASPGQGGVVRTFVRAGEYVNAGQRILMFHDPRRIWVEANVKETDVARLRPGMRAVLRVDAFPGEEFHGSIQRIGRAATSKFALLPSVNPSGNFTRITQRLPLRIAIDAGSRPLRPGMLVEVDVGTRND
jgi:membrane fusion protein (multidrug efflux system)